MSTTSRDSLFPAASIGRSAIPRSASPSPSLREPLATHPLLSPSPSSSTSPVNSPLEATYAPTTKYVPYTPKHRVASSATTGTTTHSPLSLSPQQHHGDATTKLQMMNLKAAAQKLNLENGSLGWAILEKLANEVEQGPEWNEIWEALASEQVTLLLPLEQSSETITTEMLKSHLIFCDEPLIPNSSPASIVTLSGLRGTLAEDTLTIRSSLHPASKTYQKIMSPITRSSALSSLPPLPTTGHAYPTFTVAASTSAISQLPLPPRPMPHVKPPLPPRPGTVAAARQASVLASPSTPTSRLVNPFASLFGARSSAPPTPTSAPPLPLAMTPTNSQSETNDNSDHPIDIYAYTIDKKIQFHRVAKSICKGLRDETKASLLLAKDGGMSGWIVDMVVEWVEGTFFPFVKTKRSGGDSYAVNQFMVETDDLLQIVQDFYSEVTDAVIDKNKRYLKHRKVKKSPSSGSGSVGGDQSSLISNTDDESISDEKAILVVHVEPTEDEEDEKVRLVMECVEGTICDLFYDRLFMPTNSDDLSHDEALASRIAALNMLDLGLEHLGVEIDASAQTQVQAIIKACGETLSSLNSPECRRPADKSALLVKAHKDLVDALSKLPPIRLRPDDEPEPALPDDTTTPKVGHSEEKEMGPIAPAKRILLEEDLEPPPIVISPVSETPLMTFPTPEPHKPTPVSGDVILPLMIFSAVKSNPPHLLSHLLYIQRFRNQAVGGEESYCLINLMAVAEFLENVDLAHLGLGDGEQASTADLSPIPILRSRSRSASIGSGPGGSPTTIGTTESRVEAAMRLRGLVEQQVDAIAGSANKVLSGVVDSSFGVLRSFLPGSSVVETPEAIIQEPRPTFGLLRRESGFSIAGLAASLPGARPKSSTGQNSTIGGGDEQSGQQMKEVASRPSSRAGGDEQESGSEDSGESEEEDEYEDEADEGHDARSIRSFESMMSERKSRRRKSTPRRGTRKSIADRLASVPGLGKLSSSYDARESPPASRRSSLLPPNHNRFDTPLSSRPTSPISLRIAPPNPRFLECSEDDLKVSEIRELLRDYRRIVEGVRAVGGFQE